MKKYKKQPKLDMHEGLSWNQCQIVLRELGLDSKKFSKWMYGQTCPVIPRDNKMGIVERVTGTYEYDLFRYVTSQKTGKEPIFD